MRADALLTVTILNSSLAGYLATKNEITDDGANTLANQLQGLSKIGIYKANNILADGKQQWGILVVLPVGTVGTGFTGQLLLTANGMFNRRYNNATGLWTDFVK